MANAELEIKIIDFTIKGETTHCNIFYTSNEPGNPLWGGGWKTKSFPKEVSAVDIINKEVAKYLDWDKGRVEYEELEADLAEQKAIGEAMQEQAIEMIAQMLYPDSVYKQEGFVAGYLHKQNEI